MRFLLFCVWRGWKRASAALPLNTAAGCAPPALCVRLRVCVCVCLFPQDKVAKFLGGLHYKKWVLFYRYQQQFGNR